MTAVDTFPEPGSCPACGRQGHVVDSRHHEHEIRRRRVCVCGCRWASVERTTHVVRGSGEVPIADP